MATIPNSRSLTNSSVDILNAIRNSASINYRDYVPVATADATVIRSIGAIIMDKPEIQNEFLNALINRIGKVYVVSKMYENPLQPLKKGILDFGDTIENIFVNIAAPHLYDPEVAESEQFKREIPDVRSAFSIRNYEAMYKQTIQDMDLRKAFLSIDGVTDLINRIVSAMYSAANYDEFEMTKFLIGKSVLNSNMAVEAFDYATDGIKGFARKVRALSNKFEFMSDTYNAAGVKTFCLKPEQYILINADFEAELDVDVLAYAFNMDKAELQGHIIRVDSFGDIDDERLAKVVPGFDGFSSDEKAKLAAIPAILIDGEYLQIYDNLVEMRTADNGQGLYRNYFLHVWKTFGINPFANAVVFAKESATVTDVIVSPDTLTLAEGESSAVSASVAGQGLISQKVTWSSSAPSTAAVDARGTVTGKSAGEATITATSEQDPTVSATVTVTIE